jgi:hypothetical protein
MPDYCALIVGANAGIVGMCKEHLGVVRPRECVGVCGAEGQPEQGTEGRRRSRVHSGRADG